jgi:hypothetical protein
LRRLFAFSQVNERNRDFTPVIEWPVPEYTRYSMNTSVIVVFLLLLPHAALGFAWMSWFRSPARLQCPQWRSGILFAALIASSLNIAMFWGYVSWLHYHYTTDAWKMRDRVYDICLFLIAFTIVGALLGQGRVRGTLCAAGVLGWFLWVTTSIGVL